jgi:hypothetical protein
MIIYFLGFLFYALPFPSPFSLQLHLHLNLFPVFFNEHDYQHSQRLYMLLTEIPHLVTCSV